MSYCRLAFCIVLLGLLPMRAVAVPLLWYPFDEASGDAIDAGDAPQTNAQLLGGATRASDSPSGTGSSLDLRVDSPVAHALAGDADDLDGLSAITVTTWLKLDAYTSGNNRLAAKQAAATFGGFSWNMNAIPNSGPVGPDNFRLGLFLGNNVSSGPADFGSAFSSDDVDAHNKWTFLAVTYDGTMAANNTKFYIGSAATPVIQLGADPDMVQLNIDGGASLFGVGYTDAAPAANTSAIGLADDVRVYRTAFNFCRTRGPFGNQRGKRSCLTGRLRTTTARSKRANYLFWRNGGPLVNKAITRDT